MEPKVPEPYEDHDKCIHPAGSRGMLPGREIQAMCEALAAKRPEEWAREDLEPLASALAGRTAIDGRAPEDRAGALALDALAEPLDQFAQAHQWYRKLVDPVYVFADPSTGHTAGAGQLRRPALPPLYPPPSGPHPPLAPAGDSGLLWRFDHDEAGRDAAFHFIGALQALNPGLVCGVLTCPQLCTFY
ncbi:hypothetical protein GPECTOR_107g164 [Gonium pectorale]|uniref:Uncharacterized protein n=1 Tax=Gonium pectorale TaxID=33097 RepID=A0A150FZK6_GONPE|nr:hypothetical protein GPECTOR_107g164 [Gonium pectorale]|eukprot:KXZ43019.1 hypothetical protein GPECTOR_107g164 [Gonium pectorale]